MSDHKEHADQRNIHVTGPEDPSWPERMRVLPGMPEKLWYIGKLPDDDVPTAAIVGARASSLYGRQTAEEFGQVLARNGIQVVSGMAEGIDGWAERGALAGGGAVFSVLGSGADVCYPSSNRDIYEKMPSRGGIISEQKPGTAPYPWTFPNRNRIISALADVVIVVEARLHSGSLITAEYAAEQGKAVYAVPGRIRDSLSAGCNRLIADGAGIACSPDVILNEFQRRADTVSLSESLDSVSRKRRKKDTAVLADAGLSAEAKTLYRALSYDEPSALSVLADTLPVSAGTLYSAVTELLLRDAVQEVFRGFLIRKP